MQRSDIRKIAKSKLKDAIVLFENKRYDGSVYICGYAVELGLKHQICKKLKWNEYPPGNNFQNYKSFKTHNLDILLSLTGKEAIIKASYFADWSNVAFWDPEARYSAIGSISKADTQNMIQSTKILLKIL
jgi:hypothetical protein